MATVLSCQGELLIADNSPKCLGNWVLTHLPDAFDYSQLDTAVLGQMLLYGFGVGLVLYSTCYGVKAVLSLFN